MTMFHFLHKKIIFKKFPRKNIISFGETMPISRIGKRKMLYRLLIKNFILLSILVFLSLSLNYVTVALVNDGIINFFFC